MFVLLKGSAPEDRGFISPLAEVGVFSARRLIKTIVVAGTGTMGTSIAEVFASHGYHVYLYGHHKKTVEKSTEYLRTICDTLCSCGAMTEEGRQTVIRNISPTTDKKCFKEADLVSENITEDMKAKQLFWKNISGIVPEDAILTSNTSGLSLTEMGHAVSHPERFCGMHWLNPPHLCPLVEVIRADGSSNETVNTVCSLVHDVEHHPVILKKETQGFIVNRLQFAVLREALHIVQEGIASPEDIDDVFKYGMGMRYACLGPFQIADLGGLDTFEKIAEYLFPDLDNSKDIPEVLKDLTEQNCFGVKTGKGFYDYPGTKGQEVISTRDKMFIELGRYLYSDKTRGAQ